MSLHPETVKGGIDVLSVTVVVGTFVDYLPQIAAAASLLWSILRIFETNVVQSLIGKIKSLFRKV